MFSLLHCTSQVSTDLGPVLNAVGKQVAFNFDIFLTNKTKTTIMHF